MSGISISLKDSITPELAKLRGEFSQDRVKLAAGGAVKRLLMDHFRDLDSSRANQLGGKRTHFYASAARGVEYDAVSDGVEVWVHNVGIAQRYYGGIIKPVNAKYLTIPARAEAYGKRAGEFTDLEVLYGRNGPYALAQREQHEIQFGVKRRKGKKEYFVKSVGISSIGGGIFYWLKKQVQQDPDPSVIPGDSIMAESAVMGMLDYINSKYSSMTRRT